MKKVFIVAGDASGDKHAARLINEIRIQRHDTQFIGIGGDEMLRSGLKSIVPLEQISVVGFWEVAKRIYFFRNLFERCKKILIEEKIDLFIPVDYPGFNIRLAGYAKKMNIPVFYYIAPQLWAWGKSRAKKFANVIDKLFVVFPFEVEYFKKEGIDAEFVGHPLLDSPDFDSQNLNFNERKNIIAFLPGSREQEIKRHLPLFKKTAEILFQKFPDYEFAIGKSSTMDKSIFKNLLNENKWKIWDNSRELMSIAKVGIVKTGTSTLEAALCGMPFSMIYKTSLITYLLGKNMVNLPYISLVNILANKKVVNEFIQSNATPEKITNDISYILNNIKHYENIQKEFLKIRFYLGVKGAAKKTAGIIIKEAGL